MHTYINDPAYTTSTTDGIQQAGEAHLARSLNIGRVIAFTGSGMSMEYGRPSWADFVNEYIKLAVDAYEDKVLGDDSIDQLWREFLSFFDDSKLKESVFQINYKEQFHLYNKRDDNERNIDDDNSIKHLLKILDYLVKNKKTEIDNSIKKFINGISKIG